MIHSLSKHAFCKEVVVASFKVLLPHLCRRTEENSDKTSLKLTGILAVFQTRYLVNATQT
jgi:hypothetical protein